MTDILSIDAKIKQKAAQLPLFVENCDSFWDKEIRPLFTNESLSFKVKTLNGKYVNYVNLDNGATTTPFASLKQHVNKMLDTYGSVHRGSGQKSIVTTREYDASRNIIRDFVGSSSDNYVIFAKNTTEAINGAATLWAKKPGKILVSDIEHSSNLLPWVTKDEVVQYRTQPDGRSIHPICCLGLLKTKLCSTEPSRMEVSVSQKLKISSRHTKIALKPSKLS
ncbi:aminotransferase class V-fold PLP-dependent enzyme [Nostoc sp.]|uniref:aminotransferase class V-fold PLP-dependent enzyme n=1 Tax=Nostoc sp. TaxID=1180 RepID=UPI002FF5DB66